MIGLAQPAACRYCGEPTHAGADDGPRHPCCPFWADTNCGRTSLPGVLSLTGRGQPEQARQSRTARRRAPMTTIEQAEQRLRQIAQRVIPCPMPDIAGGWDLCAHAVPWPCPITEAAWIARDLDRDEQIRRHTDWLAAELASGRL